MQTRANNQGHQNEGLVPDTITAGFKIFQLLIKTSKATSIKFLQVNFWKINQVILKCPNHFIDKTYKKQSKTEKMNIPSNFIYLK